MDGTERANGPMMQPCAMLMMMGRETRADVQREEEEEEKRRMDRVLCMCAIVFTNYGINETQLQIDI